MCDDQDEPSWAMPVPFVSGANHCGPVGCLRRTIRIIDRFAAPKYGMPAGRWAGAFTSSSGMEIGHDTLIASHVWDVARAVGFNIPLFTE